MKKLLLFAFLTSSLSIFAQTEKGTWMIQGDTNLSFSSATSEVEFDGESQGNELSTGTVAFKPAVNYFVVDNLAIGLGFELLSASTEFSGLENTSATFAFMPQITYFFGTSKTRPYLGIELGLMSQKSTTENGRFESTVSGFGYGLSGGAAIFISDNVSFNLGLEFGGASLTDTDDDRLKVNVGGFDLTAGFSIFL